MAHAPSRIGAHTRIGPALAIALVLHAILLLLPLSRQLPLDGHESIEIQVQLINAGSKPVDRKPVSPATPAEGVIEVKPAPPPMQASVLSGPSTVNLTAIRREQDQLPDRLSPDPKSMLDTDQLTHRILASPYISEESVTDQLFGKAPVQDIPDPDYHRPAQEDMFTVLNAPLPELPFDYAQGLMKFSYEPGAIGKVQRFFDVITPEFGWTTRYGTKVECAWVLVIVACGWGR